MPKPIVNPTSAHTVVPPMAGQDYHAVVHSDSGREVSRHLDAASAAVEQARLNKLDKK
jgi:hypothetical protein